MRFLIAVALLVTISRFSLAQTLPSISPIEHFQGKMVGFGPRLHPVLHVQREHNGIDFLVPMGTPVLATGNGKVVEADTIQNYGVVLRIQHGSHLQTFYAHLHDFVVTKGQPVKRGQVIGHAGNSGLSSGPHLHYEVIEKGKSVDPKPFIVQN